MKPLPHPAIYAILYFPFGALGGFITVAMTFLATRNGLTITEGAAFGATQLLISWLKWTWAPAVDVTLTPKRWYRLSTGLSALAVLGLAAFPVNAENLPLLLGIVALGSFVNSAVGMSVEAIMAFATPPDQQGRAAGWFQVGNLGGNGIGGGLGLVLLQVLPSPWMAGAFMGLIFLACGFALRTLPDPPPHRVPGGPVGAVRKVVGDVAVIFKTQGGLLAGILCFLPVGTGAASGVLTQAAVAAEWGAGDVEVALMQGALAGVIMAGGCLVGGWLCDRIPPRTAYAGFGLLLAAAAAGMGLVPKSVSAFVACSAVYNFGVGLAYAAFTATVLNAMGQGSAATKYNLYASLSNFPIWWLGMLLAVVADAYGASAMLYAEAVLGVVGVGLFLIATKVVKRTQLPIAAP